MTEETMAMTIERQYVTEVVAAREARFNRLKEAYPVGMKITAYTLAGEVKKLIVHGLRINLLALYAVSPKYRETIACTDKDGKSIEIEASDIIADSWGDE